MYCKYCGNEIQQNQKFCARCGAQVSVGAGNGVERPQRKKKKRWPFAVAAVCGVAVVLVAVFLVIANNSVESADEEYARYLKIDNAVDEIERQYRNDDGYHDPQDVPNLLAEIENYGKAHPEDIVEVDSEGDCVDFELVDGSLYVFAPNLEGVLSGGADCSVVTLEPYWTDVENADSLRLEVSDEMAVALAGLLGFGDDADKAELSEFDYYASAIARKLDEYTCSGRDNVNDADVTVDRLKHLGSNQFVAYFGHGNCSSKVGPYITIGEKETKETREKYRELFKSKQLISGHCDNRIGVTSRFFNSDNFSEDAFSGTDFFLLACGSCKDDRLSDALLSLGARTVTGFSESVYRDYGINMFCGMLGIDEEIPGLLTVGDDGQYLTFAQSLENAKRKYGDEDPEQAEKSQHWWNFEHDPAHVVCHPEAVASSARLSDTLVVYLDSDNGGSIEGKAREFVRAWYNDWTFENGQMTIDQTPISERCLPYIADGTDLYFEFSDETNYYPGSGSRLSRSAALSVAGVSTVLVDSNTCTVDVAFYGAQNTITQEIYDNMTSQPANHNTWVLTFDDAGKIIGLESGASGEDGATDDVGAETDGALYGSVLDAYRSGLNSDIQPSYDTVNPEAWAARDYNRGRYAYALYDLNGDGSDELLIGLEESSPAPEQGLEVYYGLYDLFTIENGVPVRVLSDEAMGSLGYRAYCVPCENGIIATGGSGGATYHSREYWLLGRSADEMSLLDKVVVDGDEYTFVGSDGGIEVLTGVDGQSRYENDVMARYAPISRFNWHLL